MSVNLTEPGSTVSVKTVSQPLSEEWFIDAPCSSRPRRGPGAGGQHD